MEVSRDKYIFLMIVLYSVFSLFWTISLQSSGVSDLTAKATVQKLNNEINSTIYNEASDLPSLNTLMDISNARRASKGIPKLQSNDTLRQVAQSRADDMASRGYYSHKNPEGLYYFDQLKQTAFANSFSCENLGLDSTLSANNYLEQWATSNKGHKECLFDPGVSHVGYGVAKLAFDHSKGYDSESYIVVSIQAVLPL